MKQNGKNDYNEMDLQIKEHNNKITFVNDTVNKIICSIIEKLLNRSKEIKQKETNVLNIIKNKIDLNIKQNRVDKIKDLLNVMICKHKEHKELSQQEIKDIIEIFCSCMKISQQQFYNDNNYKISNEIDMKMIIASCLLNETPKPTLDKKKKHKTTSLNNYVNNSIVCKGYIKPSIRIQKNNKHPHSHLSYNQLIGNNDSLTSYLNKKCENIITEQPTINHNQTLSQQSKIKLQKPINKINQRNNCNISKSHLRTFSIENNKIKRSISTLSKQSRVETTKESLSKKKSLKSEKYAELFVNVNTLSEKSKLTNKKTPFDNSSIYSEGNLNINNINTNNSQSKQEIELTHTLQNVKRNKSNDRDTSFSKRKRGIGSIPKKHCIKRLNSVNAKITPPSLLNDYDNKKERIKTKAKLSYMIHILSKLFKSKVKEMVIRCFYEFYFLYKEPINITFKRQQRPTHKLTLQSLFRKYFFNFISFSLYQLIPIYNKAIKKSNVNKLKLQVNNSNNNKLKSQSSYIQNKDKKRNFNNEQLMIYMPNPQDYKDDYEMLIKKPTLVNIDINNNYDKLTTEQYDYIYISDDELINKENISELLEKQQERLCTHNNIQHNDQERQYLFNNESLIQDSERDANISEGSESDEFQSVPLMINSKYNNDNKQDKEEKSNCSKYYEALNRLKHLNEETKKIGENMKAFLDGVQD